MKIPIYLDNHASTPVDPRVVESMLPFFSEHYGNPASQTHAFGKKADQAVEKARAQVAGLMGADSHEIIFTAGATESNNLAIKGLAEVYGDKKNHLITQVTEHKCVLKTCADLERKGFRVTYLKVDEQGRISLQELKSAITPETLLISVMAANNEIGTIQPIQEVGQIAKEKQIFFHVDAAQAVGKIAVNVVSDGIDLLSFSGHKMYGPKGVGALYVRKRVPRVRLAPIIHGGGQEENLRSGTLNVPGIVGLGRACEIAQKEMDEESVRIRDLRNKLFEGLKQELDEVYLNGDPEKGLPNNLNVSFLYADAEPLLEALSPEMAVSTGSACISAMSEPSFVLKALGISQQRINSSIRFGLGRFTTPEEIDYVIPKVVSAVKCARESSPFIG